MSDDRLRYPIGTYEATAPVSVAQRLEYIEQIAQTPQRFRDAVAGLTDVQLDTTYRDGGWTVRQVVHHVVDSHMNAYIRFKLALTEDKPIIKPYTESLWADLPEARSAPPELSLELLDALHRRWVIALRSISDDDFTHRGYMHPEYKRYYPLDVALGLYAWHGRHHAAHITSLRDRQGWW